MKYIDSFMLEKTGIDVINSVAADIKEISNYIENNYLNYFKNYITPFDDAKINNLYDYYKYILSDKTKASWEILVYEKGLRTFNAYRGMSADMFKSKHRVMTADEMLEKQKREITDEEIEGLLCLK